MPPPRRPWLLLLRPASAEPDELLNDIMAELGGEPGQGPSLEDSLGLPLGDSYTEDFFGDEDSEED